MENKPKVPGHKVMSKGELVKEHEHLVKVLKEKKKESLDKEHEKQEGELKGYKKIKEKTNGRTKECED